MADEDKTTVLPHDELADAFGEDPFDQDPYEFHGSKSHHDYVSDSSDDAIPTYVPRHVGRPLSADETLTIEEPLVADASLRKDEEPFIDSVADNDPSLANETYREEDSFLKGETTSSSDAMSNVGLFSRDSSKAETYFETNSQRDISSSLSREKFWMMRHQGLTVALVLFGIILVAGGLFTAAAFGIMGAADARAQAQEEVPGELGPIKDANLPYLDMRITAFSLDAYPIISTNIAVKNTNGDALPELLAKDFDITETALNDSASSDKEAQDTPIELVSFVFDPVGSSCQLTYKTTQALPDTSHKFSFVLKSDTGYRGSTEVTYQAPDLDQTAKREAETKKIRGYNWYY